MRNTLVTHGATRFGGIINKEQLAYRIIPPTIFFFNDQIYPPIDVWKLLIVDWVLEQHLPQSLPNGSIDLWAINENYDNYPVNELRVTMRGEQNECPPDTDPPQLTYVEVAPVGRSRFRFWQRSRWYSL